MKKNFYLQHPLMAMNDPRMQKLVDKERFRGIGAYWYIIEKLALLPEPRAQLEYLRPFCKGRKTSFAYVKKIIFDYQLFLIEESGYFMPYELNPVRQSQEKSAKSAEKRKGNKPKEDKKMQNMQKNAQEANTPIQRKAQDTNEIHKEPDVNNKENIKDILITTTTTNTAAAAVDNNRQICPWQELLDKFSLDSIWVETACMKSGYSVLLAQHFQEAVGIFKQHILLYDKGKDLLNISDIRRYFANFITPGSLTSKRLQEELLRLDRNARKNTVNPYRHEQHINGKRTYLGCPIPNNAPPRPSDTAFWNEAMHTWSE